MVAERRAKPRPARCSHLSDTRATRLHPGWRWLLTEDNLVRQRRERRIRTEAVTMVIFDNPATVPAPAGQYSHVARAELGDKTILQLSAPISPT